ncbi:DoxX family protein [Xanthobacter flavus]|uniref:DoxX family protein n=1 Tax=Xanthobacter flavus TaxID=281 RepID=UPI00372A83FE
MSTTTSTHVTSAKINILIWVLRVLMAGLFLFAAFGKLSGQPMMVQEFNAIGLGQWFRYFTGAIEVVGAVALLVPAVSGFAAVLLLLVDIGAFVAQVAILHVDWIHTIVIGAILAALIYLQRANIKARLGL